MKNSVLRGWHRPEAAHTPAGIAECFQAAAGNMRHKLLSFMDAADWKGHKALCEAAVLDEQVRVKCGPITVEEQRRRVSVETATLAFRLVIRRVLQELGDPSITLFSLPENKTELALGSEHVIHRRKGSAGFAIDNHEPGAGFPVDLAVELEGRDLLLFDTTLSWESWRVAQDVDEQRFVRVREAIEQARASGVHLHKFDVLLDDGGRQRADTTRRPVPGIHAFSVPLRSDAFSIAETTLGRMRPFAAPKHDEDDKPI